MLMTSAELRKICKEHELYQTPCVNDKLFCNLRGFRNIANLEPYTGLKALFLEGNCLQDVDGIPELDLLRCLCVTAPVCQIAIPVGQVVFTSIAQSSNPMLTEFLFTHFLFRLAVICNKTLSTTWVACNGCLGSRY